MRNSFALLMNLQPPLMRYQPLVFRVKRKISSVLSRVGVAKLGDGWLLDFSTRVADLRAVEKYPTVRGRGGQLRKVIFA